MTRLIFAVILALTACAPAQNARVAPTVAQVQAQAAQAKQYWGVIKGMAMVAEAANPALVAVLQPRMDAIDSLIVTADAGLALAVVDIAAIQALTAQIQAQAQTVATQAAPAIKVVAGPVPKG